MKEVISKYATPVSHLGNSRIGRVSDYPIDYEANSEVSKVEDYVPSAGVYEPAKTLESDSIVSHRGLSVCESMYIIIWEWVPVESTDISAQRIQLSATLEKDTEEWPVTSDFEGIANDACIEFCNSRGLISDLRKCINQAENIFSNRQNLTAKYDCYPIDEYEEEGHITIRVEVDSDQETTFKEYDAFTDWMLDTIADENLDFFVLTVNRIE